METNKEVAEETEPFVPDDKHQAMMRSLIEGVNDWASYLSTYMAEFKEDADPANPVDNLSWFTEIMEMIYSIAQVLGPASENLMDYCAVNGLLTKELQVSKPKLQLPGKDF